MTRRCFKYLLFFYLVLPFLSHGQDTIFYSTPGQNIKIGKSVSILEDNANSFTIDEAIKSDKFVKCQLEVPNENISASSFWVKFTVRNNTDKNDLVLNLAFPTIDSVLFVSLRPDGSKIVEATGEYVPYFKREYKHQDYLFDLAVPPGEYSSFLIKVSASEQLQLPMIIGTVKSISDDLNLNDLLFGMYAGLVLVMLLYNLFLLFTVRDRSYFYYVGYILFVGLTQFCLKGYAPRFFFPSSYYLANAMLVWIPALSGISSIMFINNFLQVRKYTPVLFKILTGFLVMYFLIILMSFTGNFRLCTGIMQLIVTILAVIVYVTAVIISRKGLRPARFFLLAWTVFIISVVVFVLRNAGVLPFNNFTSYAMEMGSAVEVVMLSIALADRINQFRKEKEESQAQAMVALQENERIVREQNVMLERKVNERTYELKLSNDDLSKAMDNLNKAMKELKDAEAQLVESEKMASLGQLTAGIAHEINNPINFVTSNVKPLNRDVNILLETVAMMAKLVKENIPEKEEEVANYMTEIDYDYLKVEIDQLLQGISEGASRTAEIVKGLRIFSRLDEDTLKRADVNEGMESTLVITNNLLNNKIIVDRQYANLPLVECYPGKLNQVFLNMISNAIYAIKKKYGDADGGVLSISTSHDEGFVYIKISDNGIGMDENTKKKLFEPFFTTKEVGEGTGLGLSIAYNTINKHNGQIIITSELGVGTEFTIKLPLVQK